MKINFEAERKKIEAEKTLLRNQIRAAESKNTGFSPRRYEYFTWREKPERIKLGNSERVLRIELRREDSEIDLPEDEILLEKLFWREDRG